MSGISAASSIARIPAENSLAPAPRVQTAQRETELTRQLDARLSGEIARIRRQISPNAQASAGQPGSVGSILDIRA